MSSTTAPDPPGTPWSLAARLTAWYAGTSFLLVLAATGYLYWVLVTQLDREDDQLLTDKVRILRGLLGERPHDLRGLRQEVEWEWSTGGPGQFAMRVLDETGRVLLETPGMADELPPDVFPEPGAAGAEPGPGTERETPSGRGFRLLAARATVGGPGGPTRLLQVAMDRGHEEELLESYRRRLGIMLVVALVGCTLGGYQIARRGLQPLAEVTATARRIRSTTLHERLATAGLPAELSVLAGTINEMLDRLEEAFARLARFSADIAHELRTPVNNLRGEIEVALGKPRSADDYRDVLGSALEECGRLARMIDSLLFLARAEHPETQLAHELLDVGRELATIRDFYEAAAGEAGVALTVQAADGIQAHLDRALFQRAVGNLVANALAHTSAGGTVTLSARQDGSAVAVEVADTGSGIPPEHLPHVFDRFYRADAARANAGGRVGLGLAIVQSIAHLHRGSVAVESTLGRGTRVRLVFPR